MFEKNLEENNLRILHILNLNVILNVKLSSIPRDKGPQEMRDGH
jgi:hypothetical protein